MPELNYQILQGNAIDLLKGMDDCSINLCVTSPPYWNKRVYGTDPTIWGGDPLCDHEFIHKFTSNTNLEGGITRKNNTFMDNSTGKPRKVQGPRGVDSWDCDKCGAFKCELGLEPDLDSLCWAKGELCNRCYICHLRVIFKEIYRVLKKDGSLWVNLGDSYAANRSYQANHGKYGSHSGDLIRGRGSRVPNGLKKKDLCLVPGRFALAMQADGFYVRSDVIWYKRNSICESVVDRPTTCHEYFYLLTKSPKYYYDLETSKEPTTDGEQMRQKRTVWDIPTEAKRGSKHTASFGGSLVRFPIEVCSRPFDTVLDPFSGTGTTGVEAIRLNRNYIGLELLQDYAVESEKALSDALLNKRQLIGNYGKQQTFNTQSVSGCSS